MWWVLLVIAALTTIAYTQQTKGYWAKAKIQSYYALDEQNRIRNGKTFYGGNLYTDGMAVSNCPEGTQIYVEALNKWFTVDDKIPEMDKGVLYVRLISEERVNTSSRIFIIFKEKDNGGKERGIRN